MLTEPQVMLEPSKDVLYRTLAGKAAKPSFSPGLSTTRKRKRDCSGKQSGNSTR